MRPVCRGPHVELVEAVVLSADLTAATRACHRPAESTSASGTDWALGIRARTQALLSTGREAEELYGESITRLGRTRLRVELGNVGRDGLRGSGEPGTQGRGRDRPQTGRRRQDEELTAQEADIAGMAGDGLSNPEIAARPFVSAHTVQYHLRKVFIKLGVTSRGQL